MNLTKLIPAAAALMFTLSSCTDIEEHSRWGYDVEPTMTAYIKGGSEQSTVLSFPENAQAGVFLKGDEASVEDASSFNRAYKILSNGTMKAVEASNAIVFPADGAKKDILAYYPYSSRLKGDKLTVNLRKQADAKSLDLLYANDANAKMGLDKNIRIGFQHTMTKLLVLVNGLEGISTENVSVTVENIDTTAVLSLNTGKVTLKSGKGNVDLVTTANNNGRLEAILAPMSNAKLVLKVRQNDQEATVTLPNVTLNAGEKVVVPLKIVGSGEDFEVAVEPLYSGLWTEYPGQEVSTPEKTIQVVKNKTIDIFAENMGNQAVTKVNKFWPRVSEYKSWSNANLTFTDANNTLSVRRFSNTNTIWFTGKKNNDFVIAGFNTAGYKTLTLIYQLNANVYDEGSSMDLAAMKGTFNGVAFDTPSQVVQNPKDKNTLTEITIELPISAAKEHSVLHFTTGAENTLGMRLANIKIVGTK